MSYTLGHVHIYVEPGQPATRYCDPRGPKPTRYLCARRKLWWTDCCRKRRWAAYVRVQVYYDTINRTCAQGHGCHSGAR